MNRRDFLKALGAAAAACAIPAEVIARQVPAVGESGLRTISGAVLFYHDGLRWVPLIGLTDWREEIDYVPPIRMIGCPEPLSLEWSARRLHAQGIVPVRDDLWRLRAELDELKLRIECESCVFEMLGFIESVRWEFHADGARGVSLVINQTKPLALYPL